MTKAAIEQRVQELHNGRPVDAATIAEIQQFLASLPPDEQIYATAYGELLAEGKIDPQPRD